MLRDDSYILVVEPHLNAIRFSAIAADGSTVWETQSKNYSIAYDERSLRQVLDAHGPVERIAAVGFRLLWGDACSQATHLIDPDFIGEYAGLILPEASYGLMTASLMRAFSYILSVPQYACFETAFFLALPPEEKYYAIPRELGVSEAVVRTGFHGIWHHNAPTLAPAAKKVVSVVIDKKCSVCGIQDGQPVTISTGRTPLEGVMGDHCCGDLDPGVVFFLMREQGYSIYKIDEILKKKSGFLGLTGSHDSPGILFGAYGKDPRVTRAFDIYKNQIVRHIGEAMAMLGGADAFVFAGAYLEDMLPILHSLLSSLTFLGINLKSLPWTPIGKAGIITRRDSPISVILTNQTIPQIVAGEINALTSRILEAVGA